MADKLREMVEDDSYDRHAFEGRMVILVASQPEPNEWYLRAEGGLMADAILNRVAVGLRYIDLYGLNMREYFEKQKGEQ